MESGQYGILLEKDSVMLRNTVFGWFSIIEVFAWETGLLPSYKKFKGEKNTNIS